MAGLRKTGLYTWEVKRLGTLPQLSLQTGTTPTGPASIAVPAPGATSTSTGWASAISQIIAGMGRAASFLDTHPGQLPYYTASMQVDPDVSSRRLRFAAAFLGSLRTDANGNYNPDQVRQILESLPEFERAMLSLQLSGRDPSSDPLDPPLTFSVDTILADIAAGRVPGQKVTVSFRIQNIPSVASRVPTSVTSTGVSMPSVPGASGGTTTATTALQNGATGAGSAAAQTTGVVDQAGQDYTSIVNATGPSASVPGYNVNQTLAPLPSSTSSMLADATWWKPALAIAIGAAVGVGLGRAIASR